MRITDVESYVGEYDRASHARFGKTKRNAVMFGPPGRAYVYFIYGMYYCLNIVTEEANFPAAVLIRGGVPISGLPRGSEAAVRGPGRLCRALHITRTHNNTDLTTSPKLYLANDGFNVKPKDIHRSPRINVNYAGEDALLPWRYSIERFE